MESVATVAKKKAKAKTGQRESLVAMRCTPEFKAWLEEFADAIRATPSQVLELGVVEMAKLHKHEPPPRR
jgi:hypothetical protein